MEVTVWGARGSIPVSGPEFVRHVVHEMGCNEVQGYAIARPMPAADFEKLLTQDCPQLHPAGAGG